MIRCAIPAGVVTADQYLGLDALAENYANQSLRVTTRQGFQLHGVIKQNLKATIAGINHTLLTTISACGDVERNVMTCPAPLYDEAHVTLRRIAREIAVQLRPATRAYHEIWLDGEKTVSTEQEEPFYGDVYLPRKFKTAIALPDDNCVDVYNDDAGLIAILEGSKIVGYNVLVGGGNIAMGWQIVAVNSSESFFFATCPTGKLVIGGGCICNSSQLEASSPLTTQWLCTCSGSGGSASAICANIR